MCAKSGYLPFDRKTGGSLPVHMSSHHPTKLPDHFLDFYRQIFHLFSTGFGSTFSTHLAISCTFSSLPHSYARLKVLCVALTANTFLFAAAYLSGRDAGGRLGLLAL